MRQFAVAAISVGCLLAASGCMTVGGPTAEEVANLPDLANREMKSVDPGQEYRITTSGICGTVEEDHVLVTRVAPGSPAAGDVQPGDKIRALQYRGIGSGREGIRAMVGKRVYRLGRDWDWHLYLTVERRSLRNGKGNRLTFDLLMPRPSDKQYHFGPTGFFAKIHPNHLEVDHVVEGSPSDGKLAVGDRIVSVAGNAIAGDVFRLFTEHIDRAEGQAGEGALRLKVERPTAPVPAAEEDDEAPVEPVVATEFRALDVTLQLAVLGDYSESVPLDCTKTDTIITRTADGIVARGKYGRIRTSLLGLLATGEQTYIDHVGKVIHGADWAKPDIELPITGGYVSWRRSYQLITLCEYYLLTKDAYVLPAMKTLANTIARGQDAAGLWNHQASNPDANFGKLHGRLYGYGAINQTSVALWIGLILAEECGVEDPEVRMAVEKTHKLYSYWIDRGRLPYGNHGAGVDFFNNNGTSGSVAVGFALLNNLDGARFFSRQSAASAREILTGHTGPWFNIFWTGIGANVAGPEVTRAFARELHWLRTVTRTWDERFLHMEAWGIKPGGHGLGSSGSTLLNLSAGRRALRITGRGMDKSLWLDAAAAEDVVAAGRIDYGARSTEELLELLGHALPPVRFRAAEMLAIKDADVTDQVMALLAGDSRSHRIGAIHAIVSLKIDAARDELMKIVGNTADDHWVRQLALRTLTQLDGTEEYAPDVLALLVTDKEDDIQGRLDEDLGTALVRLADSDPYAAGLDQDQLYQGVHKLLDHKRQGARGAGMSLLKQMPLEDLHRVANKMIYVIKDTDRTYVSYHGDGHRQTGLDILYGLNIDESLDLTLGTIHEKVGRGWRARNRKAFMKTWGKEATRVIPQIKEVLGKEADEFIEIIEEAETGRRMIRLEEATRTGQE